MQKSWIYWINVALGGTIAILAAYIVGYYATGTSKFSVKELMPKTATLPRNIFGGKKEDYAAIGPPFLHLNFSPIQLQLPDLRNYLVYYGRNKRPDADPERSPLHFAFSGSKDIVPIPPGQPLYLVYDKEQPRIKYLFSPHNEKTSLWIEAKAEEQEATIQVAMKNETGEIIREPKLHAEFKLKQREFARMGGQKWELGKWRVDGTLLARQRARWFGHDLFLEKHGGEDFRDLHGKQRIDFADDEDSYSVYLDAGDCAAWIGDRWQVIKPGEESKKYPLLVVNKIDERLMKLDLWKLGGQGKISLNLIKSAETSSIWQNLQMAFKFVGARTKSQLLFEFNDERLLLRPKDWLLLVDGKWKKLTTEEEIDDYVNRKTVGPLFVIDGVGNDEEVGQVLKATHYNATRTDAKTVDIPLQQITKTKTSFKHPSFAVLNDDEGDDEDDEGQEYGHPDMEEIKRFKNYLGELRERERS